MNLALTNFILNNNNFYNHLTKFNKNIIKNLDEYFNINYCFRHLNKVAPFENSIYICIGKKNKKYYLYNCIFRYNNELQDIIINCEKSKIIREQSMNDYYRVTDSIILNNGLDILFKNSIEYKDI